MSFAREVLHHIRIKLSDALLDLAMRVDPSPPQELSDLPAVLHETTSLLPVSEEQQTAETLRHLADLVESGECTALLVNWDGPSGPCESSLRWSQTAGQA